MSTERPRPVPDAETAPYWAAAREHRLVVQSCLDCGRPRFYPRALCPNCGSPRAEWVQCRGTGTVYSHTVVHRPPSPAFAGDIPYVVAIVELEEGPHLMTSIVGCSPESVHIGMPVQVVFRDLDEEIALPVFEPRQP